MVTRWPTARKYMFALRMQQTVWGCRELFP